MKKTSLSLLFLLIAPFLYCPNFIFSCRKCDYTTDRKSDMIRHKTMHTRNKPYKPRRRYKCTMCHYTSSMKRKLDLHIKTDYILETIPNSSDISRKEEKVFLEDCQILLDLHDAALRHKNLRLTKHVW